MRRRVAATAAAFCLGLLLAVPAPGATLRVSIDAADGGDGTSWPVAYGDLQVALADAAAGDEVWVAAGTYCPAGPDGDRQASFQMRQGVAIYGGFAGSETARDERDWAANPTVLSGDLNGDDNANVAVDEPTRQDNSCHVVLGASNATLDGFIVTGGSQSGGNGGGLYNYYSSPTVANCVFTSNSAMYGGGVYNYYSSPTVVNCVLTGNSAQSGGGLYNYYVSSPAVAGCTFTGNSAVDGGGLYSDYYSSPTLTDCVIAGNTARYYGGGLYAFYHSSPALTDCTIAGNTAQYYGGGAYSYYYSSPTLTDCVIAGNTARYYGGGVYSDWSGSPTLTNCTFTGNSASGGGGLYSSDSSPTVTNCILWGDTADDGPELSGDWLADPLVTYSCIAGGYPGVGNIAADPLFLAADRGVLRLLPGSPAIDAGSNVPWDGVAAPLDMSGLPRRVNGTVDMGAFEYQAGDEPPAATIGQAADQPDPTRDQPILFTVWFSVPVADFATGDVTVGGTAGATVAEVSELPPNDGTTYQVAVSDMAASAGTVVASVPVGVAHDAEGHASLAAVATDNSVSYDAALCELVLAVSPEGAGTVSPWSGAAYVAPQEWIQIRASAGPGCRFVAWTLVGDGEFMAGGAGRADSVRLAGDATATAVFVAVDPLDLADAVDSELPFTLGGGDAWSRQTGVTHDGVDAARSGVIGDRETTWFEATVTGPGPAEFWWRVSSEGDCDWLQFAVDGVEQGRISGEVDWQRFPLDVGPGVHTLRWSYTKDGDSGEGQDCGWVDQVSTDSDGDGLVDRWELDWFGNLDQPGTADPDGDGLTNLQEYWIGTDPQTPETDWLAVGDQALRAHCLAVAHLAYGKARLLAPADPAAAVMRAATLMGDLFEAPPANLQTALDSWQVTYTPDVYADQAGAHVLESEPYQDLNGNGHHDDAEPFWDDNGNGVFDEGDEDYRDLNDNGQWDAAEPFTDVNANGEWDDSLVPAAAWGANDSVDVVRDTARERIQEALALLGQAEVAAPGWRHEVTDDMLPHPGSDTPAAEAYNVDRVDVLFAEAALNLVECGLEFLAGYDVNVDYDSLREADPNAIAALWEEHDSFLTVRDTTSFDRARASLQTALQKGKAGIEALLAQPGADPAGFVATRDVTTEDWQKALGYVNDALASLAGPTAVSVEGHDPLMVHLDRLFTAPLSRDNVLPYNFHEPAVDWIAVDPTLNGLCPQETVASWYRHTTDWTDDDTAPWHMDDADVQLADAALDIANGVLKLAEGYDLHSDYGAMGRPHFEFTQAFWDANGDLLTVRNQPSFAQSEALFRSGLQRAVAGIDTLLAAPYSDGVAASVGLSREDWEEARGYLQDVLASLAASSQIAPRDRDPFMLHLGRLFESPLTRADVPRSRVVDGQEEIDYETLPDPTLHGLLPDWSRADLYARVTDVLDAPAVGAPTEWGTTTESRLLGPSGRPTLRWASSWDWWTEDWTRDGLVFDEYVSRFDVWRTVVTPAGGDRVCVASLPVAGFGPDEAWHFTDTVAPPPGEEWEYEVRVVFRSPAEGAEAGVACQPHVRFALDSDGDELADWWEWLWRPATGHLDPNRDDDGDGLDNLEECRLRSNPDLGDTDDDGLDDAFEDLVGLDPTVADIAEGDTDLDGYTLAEELALGTDADDNRSSPAGGRIFKPVSTSEDGLLAGVYTGDGGAPTITPDGRYVTFVSGADGLVPDDTNATLDVFVRDLASGTTCRVSLSSQGEEGDDASFGARLTPDGRYVVFVSRASNLVADDTNGTADVFVRDLTSGTTVRASLADTGEQADRDCVAPQITPDGRYVVFASGAGVLVADDTNDVADIFVRDLVLGTTARANVTSAGDEADGPSGAPQITPDGRCVVFQSEATNLVADDTNEVQDIFVRDVAAGTTQRVSLAATGEQAAGACWRPRITPDARFVAFLSEQGDLAPGGDPWLAGLFLHDRVTGETSVLLSDVQRGWEDGELLGFSASTSLRHVVSWSEFAGGSLVDREESTTYYAREATDALADSPVWSAVIGQPEAEGRFVAVSDRGDAVFVVSGSSGVPLCFAAYWLDTDGDGYTDQYERRNGMDYRVAEGVPTVAFEAAAQGVSEASGSVTIAVRLSVASTADVSVPYAVQSTSTAVDPADYGIAPSPLVIPAGTLTGVLSVTLVNDLLAEPGETVIVQLGRPTAAALAAPSTHTLTIVDEDTDDDRLADDWERTHFATLDCRPSDDPDGDGLVNYEEFLSGADPNDLDTDNDGYRDLGEVLLGASPSDPADPNRDVIIAGTVYGPDGVTPLAGCVVGAVVKPARGGHWPTLCFSRPPTSASGTYSVAVPTGAEVTLIAMQADDFAVLPVAPFYVPLFHPGVTTPTEATLFTRPAPALISGIDFTLPPGGVVTGAATDAANGQPVPYAAVDALDVDTGALLIRSRARADGTYSLPVPTDREFVLRASHDWFRDTYCDGLPSAEGARRFMFIAATDSLAGVDFALNRRTEVGDHVGQVDASLARDAGLPGDAEAWRGRLAVLTGGAVERITVHTPGGRELTVPQIPHQSSGSVTTECTFDLWAGTFSWSYEFVETTSEALAAYGDGVYVFTCHLRDGTAVRTMVPLATPAPAQAPAFTSPAHLATVLTPVTLTWTPCTGPATAEPAVSVKTTSGEGIAAADLPAGTASWGPVALLPGGQYRAELGFRNRMQGLNPDGIPYTAEKSRWSSCRFSVTGPCFISGAVTYAGGQPGPLRVQAFTNAGFAGAPVCEAVYATVVSAYRLGPIAAGQYWLHAFLDGDGDGGLDPVEALGTLAANPVTITTVDLTGQDIQLVDPDLTGARVTRSEPPRFLSGSASAVRLFFSEPMDQTSFVPAVDLVRFRGPADPGTDIPVTGSRWLDETTLEVTFPAQSATGAYAMEFRPGIYDLAPRGANPLDQDRDGVNGESPDDHYTAGFSIVSGPWVVQHTPSGDQVTPVAELTVTFSEAVVPSSFTVDDLVLLGPAGSIPVTAAPVSLGPTAFRVAFPRQTGFGQYHLLVGPDIRNSGGQAMDQNGNGVAGELGNPQDLVAAPGDRYDAAFAIVDSTGPYVTALTPTCTRGPVSRLDVRFAEPVDPESLAATDATLRTPAGALLTPDSVTTLADGATVALVFTPQDAPGTYRLTVGPDVTDLVGNRMDQDRDGQKGEAQDDQFVASVVLDRTPPRVTASAPTGVLNTVARSVEVTFSEPMDPGSVTPEALTVTGPDGVARPATAVAPVLTRGPDAGGRDGQRDALPPVFLFTVPASELDGLFHVALAPTVTDLAGNALDQDGDGTAGEPEQDRFGAEFAQALPDLVVTDIVLPAEARAGQTVEVRWTVTNQGLGPATGTWRDGVWLFDEAPQRGEAPPAVGDEDADFGVRRLDAALAGRGASSVGAKVPVLDQSEESRAVVGAPRGGPDTSVDNSLTVAPGASYTRVVAVTVPAAFSREVWVEVATDTAAQLDEAGGQANNALVKTPPLWLTQRPYPDLQVTAVVAPATLPAGEQATISWTVRNLGTGPASGAGWYDNVCLSVDTTLGAGDTRVDHVRNTDFLAPGEAYTRTADIAIPDTLAGGRYFVLVMCDADDAVEEFDKEGNNVAGSHNSVELGVPPPAVLTVESVTGPTTVAPRSHPVISWTVRNTGGTTIRTGWSNGTGWDDAMAFSTDPVYDPGDYWLGSHRYWHGCPLAPGQAYVQTLPPEGQIPDWAPGNYYLIVLPDTHFGADSGFGQSVVARSYYALPVVLANPTPSDLVAQVADPPATAMVGQTLAVGWTVVNQGTGSADATWADRTWLSADRVLDAGDILLGPAGRVSALGVGQSYRQQVGFRVPGTAVGNYYLLVKADADGAVHESDEGNNVCASVTTVTVDRIDCDLQVASAEVVGPVTAVAGQPLTVRWTAGNAGPDATPVAQWTDKVFLSQDQALEPQTDRFLGTFAHDGALAAGGTYSTEQQVVVPARVEGAWYLFVVVDAGDALFETTGEGNNVFPLAGPLQVSDPAADLLPTAAAVPATATAAQTLTVTWSVANRGEATATGSWTDRAYLSSDQTLDLPGAAGGSAADLLLGTVVHAGPLASAAPPYTVTQAFTVPDRTEGTYWVFVVVDASDTVYEKGRDSDNTRLADAPVVVTDLVSDLYVVSAGMPASGYAGRTVDVNWTVGNRGTEAAAGAWKDYVYLSSDDQFDPVTDRAFGVFEHSGGLAFGATYTTQSTRFVARLPERIAGTFHVFVVTDVLAAVYEKGVEANNVLLVPGTIAVHNSPADLQVAVVTAPAFAVAGSAITVTWAVANSGEEATKESDWQDGVYLSSDATLAPAGDIELGLVPHSGVLNQGATCDASAAFVLRQDLSGPYTVYVVADARRQVYEYTAEDNNSLAADTPLQIQGVAADLQVTALAADPTTTAAGSTVTVTWTVTNLGVDPTPAAAWSDHVYLSRDAVLDTDDTELGAFRHQGALLAAAPRSQVRSPAFTRSGAPPAEAGTPNPARSASSYTRTEPVTVPAARSAGTYHLIVKTDANSANDVFELGAEANNAAAAALEVVLSPVADLQVTTVAAPAAAWSGQTIAVAWTVANQGAAPATGERGEWVDSVYLSRDPYLDPDSDLRLGGVSYRGTLAAALEGERPREPGSYTQALDGRLPEDISGAWYVFVRTDSTDSVFERDGEANNTTVATTVVTVNLTPPADLVVVAVVAPASAAPGAAVTWQCTVRNAGTLPARGTWWDSLYLSADDTWDFGDLRIARVKHEGDLGVGPAAHYTATVTAVVPPVVPGAYRVIARTDILDDVRETDDANNDGVSAAPITVQGVDLAADQATSLGLAAGQDVYYQTTPGEGKDVEVRLTGADITDAELYVSAGQLPTRSSFGYRGAPSGDDALVVRVPGTTAQTYYILVHGRTAARAQYTLSVTILDEVVTGISPSQGDNTGSVTVRIGGAGFDAATRVTLEGGSLGGSAPVADVYLQDSSTMYATFDLAGLAPGACTLVVANAGGVFGSRPFSVIAGTGGHFWYRIENATVVRPGRAYPLSFVYGNDGTAAIGAPLVTLSIGDSGHLRLSPSAAFTTQSVQFLAIAQDGPAGSLAPGCQCRIDVEFQIDASVYVPFYVSVVGTDSTEPIDWPAMEEAARPAGAAPGTAEWQAWTALWASLVAQTGTTWGDAVRMLDRNNTYLAQFGLGRGRYGIGVIPSSAFTVIDRAGATSPDRLSLAPIIEHWLSWYLPGLANYVAVDKLWGFQFMLADGLGPVRELESAVDAVADTPGVSLALARSFPARISQRHVLGPFGRGWTHNWQTRFDQAADGAVTVTGPGGSRRVFTPATGGAYTPQTGDHGVLAAAAGGGFTLAETSGLVTAFLPDGRLASVTDPNGNRATAGYTGGLLTTLQHSSGQALNLAYDGDGRIVGVTDAVGRQATFEYDSAGEHLVAATYPDGRRVTYGYSVGEADPLEHALVSARYPGNVERRFDYDAVGRLRALRKGDGVEATTFVYASGRTSVTDGLGNTSRLDYDDHGLLVRTVDALGNTVQLAYDSGYNLARVTDPAYRSQSYGYDSRGNLVRHRNALGNVTAFEYSDSSGRLTSVRDANGNSTWYDRDSSANLAAITYADGTRESWAYDPVGNPAAWTNRRGQQITYHYDAAGRLTAKVFPDGSRYDYLYDAGTGHLLSVTDPTGTTAYEYHPGTDWVKRIGYPQDRFLEFTYDGAGRRASSVDQLGHRLEYVYDGAGRLWYMTDEAAAEVVRYAYDDAGRLTRKTLGNGVYTRYVYDAAGQVLSLTNYKPDGSVLSGFDYTYDSRGRRTAMATLDGLWTYDYDDTGQLTRAVFDSLVPGEIPDQDLTYVYDPLGNRIRTIENGVTTDYTTNNMNQYTECRVSGAEGQVTAFQYDADGSMIAEFAPDTTTTYAYSPENRLVGVSRSGAAGASTWSYAYDAFGNRVASTENGVATHFVIDPIGLGNLVGEYAEDGNVVARYDHWLGLIGRAESSGGSAFYTFDAVGNVQELVTSGGAVANSYSYRPFGATIRHVAPIPSPFGFVGQWGVTADSTGLDHMGARQYGPALGRFGSTDPLNLLGGDFNLYGYVQNSPVTRVDPSGCGHFVKWFLFNGDASPWATYSALLNPYADWGNLELVHEQYVFDDGANIGFGNGGTAEYYAGDMSSLFKKASIPRGAVPTSGEFRDDLMRLALQRLIDAGYGQAKYDWYLFNCQSWAERLREEYQRVLEEQAGGATGAGSHDPNDKLIAVGEGQFRHITPDTVLPYTIRFENDKNASASAQLVTITDPLSAHVDPWTFELGDMEFGSHRITVPPGLMYYTTDVDLRPEGNSLVVRIEADFDPLTSVATWTFTGIDPATGELTEDALAGFLPPNVTSPEGEGFVTFTVAPKPNLPSGTRIENVATIVFDWNEPMNTPLVFNTIDAGAPTSHVDPLPAVSPAEIPVSWTGVDDNGGVGIASYDVYVQVDSGSWQLWLADTAATSALYPGAGAHTYSFYCVATDAVGHTEAKAPVAEATTVANTMPTIVLAEPPAGLTLNPGDTHVITWTDADPDDNATITLFWDTDTDVLNNTTIRRQDTPAWGLIADGISEGDAANSFAWTVPAQLAGLQVYLGAVITDGVGTGVGYTRRALAIGDADHDGLLDAWERVAIATLGIATVEAFRPQDDSDGDGWTNQQEYDAGSDPADPDSLPEWSLSLYASGASVAELVIGYAADATDGWDAALDQATDATSLYLAGPAGDTAHPRLSQHIRAPAARLAWALAADPVREPIELAWNPAHIPADHALFLTPLVDGLADPAASLDMVATASLSVSSTTDYRIELEPPRTQSLDLQPGWNLVSLPVQPSRADVASVLQGLASGPVWGWRADPAGGRYEALAQFDALAGAWVYVRNSVGSGVSVRGRPLRNALVHLQAGWNLVGPLAACPVPTTPAVPGPAWGWDPVASAYVPVPVGGTMTPGRAYWLAASAETDVCLGE